MIKNPLKTLALAAGTLALAATANAAFVTYDWGLDDLQGWTVVNGEANFEGDGLNAGHNGGAYAHDANHPNFVVTSPVPITIAGAPSGIPLVEIDWQGGSNGGSNAPTIPVSRADAIGYNGGDSNDLGGKGLGFYNTVTGAYDLIAHKDANGGDETDSFQLADLGALDPAVNYRLDYYDNDGGGWGWTRPRDVRIDDSIIVPEPSSVSLLGLGAFALLFFRRRRK